MRQDYSGEVRMLRSETREQYEQIQALKKEVKQLKEWSDGQHRRILELERELAMK
jgi:predicted RNase H-like nuclease (RuvC/YqgF family)